MLSDLPFFESDELSNDIPSLPNSIPFTNVNSKPLDDTPFIAPFVACPIEIVNQALSFANVKKIDILVDLGCGDGRILKCALACGIKKAIGVELDPYLVEFVRNQLGMDDRVEIIESDMFEVDLLKLQASVMVLYLLPKGLENLKNMFLKWLGHIESSEKRIITIQYRIPNWEPIHTKKIGKFDLYYYKK